MNGTVCNYIYDRERMEEGRNGREMTRHEVRERDPLPALSLSLSGVLEQINAGGLLKGTVEFKETLSRIQQNV
jgi:hypothetical protein